MSSIRNQFPRESEEQHRKRFIEMVRKWRLEDQRGNCEEPVCRLRNPRLSMSVLFGRGKHNDRFIESGHGNGRTRVKPGSAKFDIVAQGQIAW